MLFRVVFLFTFILLHVVFGVMKEQPPFVTRMGDIEEKKPDASTDVVEKMVKKSDQSMIVDERPGSGEEDVVVVASYGDGSRQGVTQMGTPPMPWIPKAPIPWSNADQPWSGPPRTTPLTSWVFITINNADLKKLLDEKERTRIPPKAALRSGGCNVPKIIELVKNLTNDYDNLKFVDNLNRSLRNMSLPTCELEPLSGDASTLTVKLLSIVSIGILLLY